MPETRFLGKAGAGMSLLKASLPALVFRIGQLVLGAGARLAVKNLGLAARPLQKAGAGILKKKDQRPSLG